MGDFDRESMLEMFTFEMNQLLESLEQNIIQGEGETGYTMDKINEIFRVMHTIKGSAAMMMFNNIAVAAHAIEDLFFYLREENPSIMDETMITDLVLETLDFVKEEIAKIEAGTPSDVEATESIARIKEYLKVIKAQNGGEPIVEAKPAAKAPQTTQEKKTSNANLNSDLNGFSAQVYFDDGCEMENVRAFTLVNNLKDIAVDISHTPEDLIDEGGIEYIRKNGLTVNFYTIKNYNEIEQILKSTIYLKTLTLQPIDNGELKKYEAKIYFDEGCEMENVRSYTVVHSLKNISSNIISEPEDLIDEASIEIIRNNGLKLIIETSKDYNELYMALESTLFLKDMRLTELDENENEPKSDSSEQIETKVNEVAIQSKPVVAAAEAPPANNQAVAKKPVGSQVISVNVNKLDQLLKLMGELVISEAMVTQNPELEQLELDSFNKEARQLRKIIKDIQDNVMSMRMVPLSTTFFKMHRIVRDMAKQLNKDIQLDIIGEETEVDKNITEHISDPLMHIIRNSADHGIELPDDRAAKGKTRKGTITLEARNSGSDVLIIIKDDGAGLNKERILNKAKNNGLLRKEPHEYSDKEIYQFVFMPGFSTNEQVTSYSGRGVGMDVVCKNLEMVGGTVIVDSTADEGSVFTLKIPLTLAIIEGMMIKMGGAKYTIPIMSIKDSFKPNMKDIFIDASGNEMITVRGEVYNIVKLYELFNVDTAITNLEEGIMIVVENGDDTICLFVDELVGEQQVVVKTIPKYINKIQGISGCTLLGNGDISLIIDVAGFFDK